MKIVFLLTQSLDSPMGIGRIGPLARALIKLGHGVTILALHPDFSSLKQKSFVQNGVNVEYVAPMHVKKIGNLKTYYSPAKTLWVAANAAFRMTRSAIRLHADVIHICKPHLMNGFAGLVTRFLRGGKLYLDCDDYEAASGHYGAGWQKKGVERLEKRLPLHVDCVTTNTFFLRNLLIKWGVPQDKIEYLSNGAERARFTRPSSAELDAFRADWGLLGKRVIVFVGSLSMPTHPVDLLLKAFKIVNTSSPETVLMLVGGGDQFEVLKNMAQELGISPALRFSGRIEPEKVAIYYYAADVSVDPIVADDIARGREPLKLFESWACGVPFVSGDVGDRRSLLDDPPAGLLAIPGDPISLAETILRILNDQTLARSLSQRGLERIKAYFWDELAQKLDSVYKKKVINSSHRIR